VLSACGGSSPHTLSSTPSGPPAITALSPAAGLPGLTVKITGTNFGSTRGAVTFNGTSAAVVNWTNTLIVVKVPAGATTGNVVVTVGDAGSNAVSFNIVSLPPNSITVSFFGFQCGTGPTNCPNQSGTKTPTWPSSQAQPGLLRLWDSQVSWSYLNTGLGSYNWAQLDGYLDDIAQFKPASVNYVFGCVPSFATSGPLTTPGSCGPNGSATPPTDLGSNGSATFNQFVTDFVNHCSQNPPNPGTHCVKDLITGYELWNEANVGTGQAIRWTGTQLQLYQMVKPAVAIIKAASPNATIFTPSITAGGASWMTFWIGTEVSNGAISDVYNIHQYLNNKLPEDVLNVTATNLAPNTSTFGWTPKPWVMGETGYDDIILPYNCNAGNTNTPYTTNDCIGQMVRWNLLLFSEGGSGLYWYYWNTYIGSDSQYSTAYASMMQYLVGGKLGGPCAPLAGGPSTTWTCNFTEAGGTTALWVWTTSESGDTITVPSGYMDYRDLSGGPATTVSSGQSISITTMPIMLEQ
jgi:hypothetical protein